jgi:hypothetical protein
MSQGIYSATSTTGGDRLYLELVVGLLGNEFGNCLKRAMLYVERSRAARCEPPFDDRIRLGDCWFSDHGCRQAETGGLEKLATFHDWLLSREHDRLTASVARNEVD